MYLVIFFDRNQERLKMRRFLKICLFLWLVLLMPNLMAKQHWNTRSDQKDLDVFKIQKKTEMNLPMFWRWTNKNNLVLVLIFINSVDKRLFICWLVIHKYHKEKSVPFEPKQKSIALVPKKFIWTKTTKPTFLWFLVKGYRWGLHFVN